MSALAKVFVVFVFILALIFFGTSATLFKVRMDWRRAYEEAKAEANSQLLKLADVNKDLNLKIDEQTQTIYEHKNREDQLAAENRSKAEELKSQEAELRVAREQVEKANIMSQDLAKTLEAATQEKENLRQALEQTKLKLDEQMANAKEARQERDSMRLDLETTQEALAQARTELQQLTEKYDTLALVHEAYEKRFGTDVLTGPPPPPIDARVTAVEPTEGLVVLSVGENDEVEEGFKFTVYRGDDFIGQVQVIRVYPELSGARVVFTKDGMSVQRGDKASTRFMGS